MIQVGTTYQQVGQTVNGQTLVATGQEVITPSETVTFGPRPVDMVLSQDGKYAYVKETTGLTVVDLTKPAVLSETPVGGGPSMCGLALSADGGTLAYTNSQNGMVLFSVAGATVTQKSVIAFPSPAIGGVPYPCGVVFNSEGTKLFVALSRSNAVCVVDVASGNIDSTFPVDVAPFGLALDEPNHRILVTCWSAFPPAGVTTQPSSGTSVQVDARGIAISGTLCSLNLSSGAITQRVAVGLQPTEVAIDGSVARVTASNADRVVNVNLTTWAIQDDIPLDNGLGGSAPNSMALARSYIYAACGGRNTIVRHNRSTGKNEETPTPWYPIAVRTAGLRLVVACNKGFGARTLNPGDPGYAAHDGEGSLSILGSNATWSSVTDDKEVNGSPIPHASPVPAREGDPSTIQHVVYILKENRTYDQVLGDISKGDSDPALTIYGQQVTPNQHALASNFVLLDNYYCNGVVSADGHAWAMEGNATNYFERSAGGWTRSYPFQGNDPLAVSRGGFIWDDLIANGKTVRDYGEGDFAFTNPAATYEQVLQDFLSGTNSIQFTHQRAIARVRAISDSAYPGWNLDIPDIVRANFFLQDFATMKQSGAMPNFMIVYLPQDHTSGTNPGAPTPRAQVADNDLAVGRIVEAVSKSSFWAHTAIFVNEDDPQDGFDHVDGHRSFCLVVSPYARRQTVVSDFYNQTSVLRTIEHMLGVPPMNRFDAASPLMSACFQDQPNLAPFTALPNNIPLTEVNPPGNDPVLIPVNAPDLANEDQLNRILWAAAKGPKTPYPARFSGPHGAGLAKRGLKLAPNVVKDDD